MATLDQHFGEDSRLPRKATAEIAAFLRVNAAETADTEPANRFREVSASDRTRITATRFWLRTHHDLPEQVFESAAVKSKTNCVACHRDALTGRFDDQQIVVPSAAQTGDKQ